MNRLRRLLKLETGEEWPVVLLFPCLTLALSSCTIVKAKRDTPFVNRFGAMASPYNYVAVACLMGWRFPAICFIWIVRREQKARTLWDHSPNPRRDSKEELCDL